LGWVLFSLAGLAPVESAHKFTVAFLVLPAGLLSGPIASFASRRARAAWILPFAAVACLSCAVGVRFDEAWGGARGERELMAHSRAGARPAPIGSSYSWL
jgi:hypothetical protein